MGMLEAYCIAAGIVRDHSRPEQGNPSLFGQQALPSPARVKTMFAAMREARLLAAELGLTPHRRAINEEKRKKDGNWDEDSDLLA
jgi:phage terminase small subunit